MLPRLRPGVLIRVHDIFLPYDYPRYLLELGAYFNEQYLLQALLSGSRDSETVLASCALVREQCARMLELLPSLATADPGFDYVPSSSWIRRAGADR